MLKKGSKFVSLRACLVTYENTKRDVNNHLKFVTSQLQRRVQSEAEFLKFRQRLNTYLQQTKGSIKKGKKFAGIKLAILIHYLFLTYTPLLRDKQRNQNNVKIFHYLNQLITSLHENLEQNRPNPLEKDKVFLNQNIILPYVFYLQKKFQYIQIKLMQMQESGYILQEDKQIQQNHLKNRLALLSQQCYKYLNLLNKGLVLSNKLLTLLTYYLQEHEFLQNFNILLATDFAPIYKNMADRFNQIREIQTNLQIESQQFRELEKQIQKAHEGMFIIYLNRYMNHMRFLAPKFIQCNHSKSNLEIFYDQKNPETTQKKKVSKIKKYLSMNSSVTFDSGAEVENDGTASEKLTNNLSSSQALSIADSLQEEYDMFEQLRGSFKKKVGDKSSSQSSSGKKTLEMRNQEAKGKLKKYLSMNNSIEFQPIVVEDDDEDEFDQFNDNLTCSQTLPQTTPFDEQDLRSSFKKKTGLKQSQEPINKSNH